ncbi:MAG: lipoic acid synthetase [Candidatus Omnitrophota bacterium]|jgi:lipoic acid synthetase
MSQRLPPWIRKSLLTDKGFSQVNSLVDTMRLKTVCEEARCPNRHECWNRGTATIMILGETCTRSCGFCAVKSGRPEGLDTDEPRRVAAAAKAMNLKHIVITSVNRDDQADGGSAIFAETIRKVKAALPECTVEVLTPDFEGVESSLANILEAGPHVYNHNLETVKRLQAAIRPQANYGRSLNTLRFASQWQPTIHAKSGIMLGLGETEEEIVEALQDLYDAGCRMLTLGQYLRPSRDHLEVVKYYEPEVFDRLAEVARDIGFPAVASGPMVRSSYRAEDLYAQVASGSMDHRSVADSTTHPASTS